MTRSSPHVRPVTAWPRTGRVARLSARACAVAASLVVLGACAPAGAATLAANPGNLGVQLGKAKAGDTVRLAPGTYDVLALSGASFSPAVTVTGQGAVLKGLNLANVEGLRLVGLEFAAPDAKGYPLVVIGCRDVRLERLNVHAGAAAWAGLMIRNSSGVNVTRSEFHHVSTGVNHLDSSDLVIEANRFHDLVTDGVRGGGSSRVAVLGNSFTDFFPGPGDHPDAIQFWTTGTTKPATDITVSGNVYVRGKGGQAQGVFITQGKSEPRYLRLKVTDNVVLGGMYNGIMVQGADEVEISGNTVAGFPDMQSWIRLGDLKDARLTGNRSQNYIFSSGKSGITEAGNASLPSVSDGGKAILKKLGPLAEIAPSAAEAAGEAGAREVTLAPGETLVVHAPSP